MTFSFVPASNIREGHGLFVALVGPTNCGKTFSGLRLARGIAGPSGKIAVLDTEGGRTLHLKNQFKFDASIMAPPFRPERFSEAAEAAEKAGYDVLLIDSFSQEWTGVGGVLEWHDEEVDRLAGDDQRKRQRVNMAAWITPKRQHKTMVSSFLQRRIPIIFSVRGEESIKPDDHGGQPQKIFKMQMDPRFAFEVTVSFKLAQDTKGYIDLADRKSYKMEGVHAHIFKDREQLSERHGEMLAAWARGEDITKTQGRVPPEPVPTGGVSMDQTPAPADAALSDEEALDLVIRADRKAEEGREKFMEWIGTLTKPEQDHLRPMWGRFKERW